MITYCAECEHVHTGSMRHNPWRWMCMKHRRAEGFGFVTLGQWDDFPPYLFCRDVNGGMCPLFEQRREATDDGH